MAFPRPYSNRKYSLYSSKGDSSSECSVSKAHQDLDRCTAILNEVLDNGAGILDGVKNRRRRSQSVDKEACYKPRQTNKALVSTSTPQVTPLTIRHRRCRSSSARPSSSQSLGPRAKKRQRSLSEQSLAQAKLRLNNIETTRRSRTRRRSVMSDASSISTNVSLASSSDTLAGVHLDNSSQYGIPPVFNPSGQRRGPNGGKRPKSKSRTDVGWLKPQTSMSTQTIGTGASGSTLTATRDKENQPEQLLHRRTRTHSANRPDKERSSHEFRSPQPKKSMKSSAKMRKVPQRQPTELKTEHALMVPTGALLPSISNNTTPKEHDVDELLERTLRADDQSFIPPRPKTPETMISRESEANTEVFDDLRAKLNQLRSAALSHNIPDFERAFTDVSETVINRATHEINAQREINGVITPFQRELNDLRQHVQVLEGRLQQSSSEPTRQLEQISDLQHKLAQSEERATQLNAELKRQRSQSQRLEGLYQQNANSNYLAGPQTHSDQRKLNTLQQTIRLIHTRLATISSHCAANTGNQLRALMDLCAQRLVDCIPASDVLEPSKLSISSTEGLRQRLALPAHSPPGNDLLNDAARISQPSPERFVRQQTSDTITQSSQPSSTIEPSLTSSYTPYHTQSPPTNDKAPYRVSPEKDQLHSTLLEDGQSMFSMSDASSLSMGTTVADSVFQDGLAQLDANIARLQESLKASVQMNFTM